MKTKIAIACLLLATSVLIAKENGPPLPPVLSLAPADALAIVYVQKPRELLQHSLLRSLEPPAEVTAMLDGAAEVLTGPMMVAFCGSPINPASIRVELAVQPSTEPAEFYKLLEEKLLPTLAWANGGASLGSSGLLRTLRLPGPIPLTVFLADKNGVIFGSGHRATVEAWLEDGEMTDRFVASDDYKRLRGENAASEDALVYFNGRTVMPLAAMEFDREAMPGLFSALGFDRFESAALALHWSGPRLGASLAIGLAEGEGGVSEILAPSNGTVRIAELVPQDYTFFMRGALTSVANTIDVMSRFLNAVDPAIVREYNEECAEFREEVGFDPHADFLGNLVDEWLVGVRVDPDGNPSFVSAVGLGDPALFEIHVGALTKAYGLEYEQGVYRDAIIRSTPPTASTRFAMATFGKYLVVAREVEQVREVVDAWSEKRSVQSSPPYRNLTKLLPAESARLAYVSLAQLCRLGADEVRATDPDSGVIADALEKLSQSETAAGVSVSTRGRVVDVHLALTDTVDRDARDLLVKSVAASLARSRALSQRAVSSANIRGIIQSCLIYANDHKGAWPDAMSTLVRDGSCTVKLFQSPLHDFPVLLTVDNLDRESSYLYRPGAGLAPSEVVVCERELCEGGANFGFADGHVEWISGDRAAELLQLMMRYTR